MELMDLRAFVSVISEGGFSKAATRLRKTQPAITQALHRLEAELGQRLLDRSSNPGKLTEAGKVLFDYAERLIRLAEDAKRSVQEVEELRRGRVLIGLNDAGVPILLPLIAEFQASYPAIFVDLRRIHSRHIPVEVIHGNLDFGLMTFHAPERRLRAVRLGNDEMVAIVYPGHPFANRPSVTVAEWAREPIVFHNEPSPARERVLQLAERRKVPLNVRVAVPTLDGIKLAVEMKMGISFLPRRCVINELDRKQLIAVPIPELGLPRDVRLVYRRASNLSQAASAFLQMVAKRHVTAAESEGRGVATPRVRERGALEMA